MQDLGFLAFLADQVIDDLARAYAGAAGKVRATRAWLREKPRRSMRVGLCLWAATAGLTLSSEVRQVLGWLVLITAPLLLLYLLERFAKWVGKLWWLYQRSRRGLVEPYGSMESENSDRASNSPQLRDRAR